jgi:hypothetical protein
VGPEHQDKEIREGQGILLVSKPMALVVGVVLVVQVGMRCAFKLVQVARADLTQSLVLLLSMAVGVEVDGLKAVLDKVVAQQDKVVQVVVVLVDYPVVYRAIFVPATALQIQEVVLVADLVQEHQGEQAGAEVVELPLLPIVELRYSTVVP